MRRTFITSAALGTLLLSVQWLSAAESAEHYLTTGQLEAGATALKAELEQSPQDDEARFGLGVIQFFQSFEHLGGSLHEYGLRTGQVFGGLPGPARDAFQPNPNPKTISYADTRKIAQTWVNDLNAAAENLSVIKDADVKLPLKVGQIKVDLFGTGTPADAATLLGRMGTPQQQKAAENFVINFDRGDARWLSGYCHFLCAWGELFLALDTEELFHCTGHLFFQKVDTPYQFLLEGNRDFTSVMRFNRPLISDILAYIHLWRFDLAEPKRMQAALAHLEAMQVQAKAMWKYYLAETDDDHEWIPNPNQTGVLEVKVTQEMLDTWQAVLDEAGLVLQGKKLIPFWRGKPGKQGVNFRRIFTEPRKVDPFLWFQGTAAAPYLEEGPITDFASPELLGRINNTFGRRNFFRMVFWFN